MSASLELNPGFPVEIDRYREHIGLVVIFSFESFRDASGELISSLEERTGGAVDRWSLNYVFRRLKFKVLTYVNKKFSEMPEIIEHLKHVVNQQKKIFICIVLSHGQNTSSFFTSDGFPMCLLEDIVVPLSGTFGTGESPTIPHFYLANMCRDDESIEGATIHPDLEPQSNMFSGFTVPVMEVLDNYEEEARNSFSLGEVYMLDDEEEVFSRITDDSRYKGKLKNTLIVFSTKPRQKSWSFKVKGSVFINSFLKILAESYNTSDLLSIIEKAGELTEQRLEHYDIKQSIQKENFELRDDVELSSKVS